jgi:antirestriction protein ArdC
MAMVGTLTSFQRKDFFVNTYDRITDRIIDLLNHGTVPWHKPWKASTGLPRNRITHKPYRGINVFLLMSMSYESPHWLTFRQVTQLGGRVKKGEKSCPVVFWKQMTIEDKASGEPQKIPLLRIYHVFNVAQCDGIEKTTESIAESSAAPAEIVTKMPRPPVIKHGMTRAFYSPSEDEVGMPARERFDCDAAYYAALFHELVHSTGHEKRLKRPSIMEGNGFGSNPYCKEELIAEMGAAFLCGQAEIVERTIDNSAAYLQGWLEQLRNDKTLIVQAAAQAQKAADFILGISPPETEVESATAKARTLKIEAVGDFAGHQVKPRIRLGGQWLEKAGFKPGHRVEISSLKPGKLSLQFKEEFVRRDSHT